MAVLQIIIKFLLITLLFCLFSFIYIFDIFCYDPFITKEYGFADINDEYTPPKIHDNFITKEEADYILNTASDKFQPSKVHIGLNKDIRNSYTAWISKEDNVVKNIIMRVCNAEGLPFKNAEHLQVVRYYPNEYYKKHFDTQHVRLNEIDHDDVSGHRAITMLIYLNDEFEEGATRFTLLKKDIKPPKYSGILFHSLGKTNKKCHPYSRHAGLPVKSGTKYVANVWVRQNKFNPEKVWFFENYYYLIKYFLESKTIKI